MSWPRIASPRGRRRVPRPPALVVLAAALVLAGCTASVASSTASPPAADVKPSALALQQQFVQVVRQVGPSVVLLQTDQGLGSGIIFDAKGDVVTNNHVVEGAGGFQVIGIPTRPPWPTCWPGWTPASRSRSRSPAPAGPGGRCGSPSASSPAETTWKENR